MPRDGAHVWRPRRADYPVPYGAGLVAVSRCERTRAETTDIPTATATPVQGRGQVGRAPVGGLTRGSVASRNLCFGGRSGLGVSEGVRSAYDPTGNVRTVSFATSNGLIDQGAGSKFRSAGACRTMMCYPLKLEAQGLLPCGTSSARCVPRYEREPT